MWSQKDHGPFLSLGEVPHVAANSSGTARAVSVCAVAIALAPC